MYPRIARQSRKDSVDNDTDLKSIEIDGREDIWSIVFLVGGRHVASGGEEGKIRCWRVKDGKEVGTPMDVGSAVGNLAASPDGKWIVSGTIAGQIAVWDVESHSKVHAFEAHPTWVRVVDVSPDATRIATGSKDRTVCVWSLSSGEQLLGPLQHNSSVGAVKFSPDGHLLATATWWRHSVRIYDSQDGNLLVDVHIQVNSALNQSIAWDSDSKRLFTLSDDGYIRCVNVLDGAILSEARIHGDKQARCIALAGNGAFIAASVESTFSFWSTATLQQVGPVIEHTPVIVSMAISADYNIVAGGGKRISLWDIYDLIPLTYYEDILPDRAVRRQAIKRVDADGLSSTEDEEDPGEENANLEENVQDLRRELASFRHTASQRENSLNDTINTLREDLRSREAISSDKISHLEQTVQKFRSELTDMQHRAYSLSQLLRAHEQKHQCEVLYAQGRILDAATALLQLTNTVDEEAMRNELIMNWVAEFTRRCASWLESMGDEASNDKKHDEAIRAYSAAMSIGLPTSCALPINWARTILSRGTVSEALGASSEYKCPRYVIYGAICDVLEGDDQILEAIECFRRMRDELGVDSNIHGARVQWESEFQQRCRGRLEKLVDNAMDSRHHNEAIEHLSAMLLLDTADRVDILIRRSKLRVSMNLWEEALSDADEVIKFESTSHQGYEMRHVILHRAERYTEATEAFHTMLSKLEESPDEHIQELRSLYVDATPTIRRIVDQTTRYMPRILIDTTTGRLYDRAQQAAAFEDLPVYSELVSSMTKQLDHARIYREVKTFYRYVMLSHKWEHDEPLLQKVMSMSVYHLESSLENIKLQTFCSLARSLGFGWAWSDTSCVDKLNNVVLQESLVAMFTWYRGSALTIVYLRGVSSKSQRPGGLRRSVWNTRGWTYQEYVAAETVQFYTEDWKPYFGLTLFNHKESPVVISEMQQATGVSAQQMAVLRPGLDRVREKLFLASVRQTTLVEDAAYSLFGIFNVAIPAIYGEGNRAVGRLLEHILTGSGDVTILAWTGTAGGYNSCLPADLTVYKQLKPPHIPAPIETAEMDRRITALRASLPDPTVAVQLYSRLNDLPSPVLAASRLRLPGIAFHLASLVCTSEPDPLTKEQVYRAETSALGEIVIRTTDDLTGMTDLCLVHPWIRPLLDQEFAVGAGALDKMTQALRFIVRLRQPFGGLLFAPVSRVEHRRVAADGLIVGRVREDVELTELIEGIRTIEVQ